MQSVALTNAHLTVENTNILLLYRYNIMVSGIYTYNNILGVRLYTTRCTTRRA